MAIIILLSTIAVVQLIFWPEDNFCFIYDSSNSFNGKVKNLQTSKTSSMTQQMHFVVSAALSGVETLKHPLFHGITFSTRSLVFLI